MIEAIRTILQPNTDASKGRQQRGCWTAAKRSVGALLLLFILAPSSVLGQVEPTFVTVADTFQTIHDQTFDSGTTSVLDNDTDLPTDSLVVIITLTPENGRLTIQPDGTFSYEPDAGFVGDDSFAYVVRSLPVQELTFSPASSVLSVDATVAISLLGSDSDTAQAPVEGTVTIDVGPNGLAPTMAHVTSLDLRNQDPIGLTFKYGSPVTLLTLDVSSEAQGMQFGLNSAGPEVATSGGFNSFTQTGNKMGVVATVDLKGSGTLESLVPSGVQNLETETDFQLDGSLPNPGEELVLILTVDIANSFDLSGNSVDLTISGTAVATGPLILGGESDPTLVTMHVISPVAIEARQELPRQARLHPVYPNPVTNEAVITFELDRPSDIRVAVYDLLGREVEVLPLLSGTTGEQRVRWRPGDMPDGMYLVRVSTGTWTETRPIVVSR